MKKLFLLITIFFGIISCSHPDSKHFVRRKTDKITRIDIASGGCYGTCWLAAISIDSSLSYKFYGGRYAPRKGFYTGKISRELWDTLNIKLDSIKFKQLDSSYRAITDDNKTELVICWGNNKKRIDGTEDGLPKNLLNVYYWLLETSKRIDLNPSIDSLKFETNIQYDIPPPPPSIKIKPPTIKPD